MQPGTAVLSCPSPPSKLDCSSWMQSPMGDFTFFASLMAQKIYESLKPWRLDNLARHFLCLFLIYDLAVGTPASRTTWALHVVASTPRSGFSVDI